jgi:hypothetical protein
LDGGKALTAAVKRHALESAAIQRCQVLKRRNVLDHLTDEQRPVVAQRLNAAYAYLLLAQRFEDGKDLEWIQDVELTYFEYDKVRRYLAEPGGLMPAKDGA